MAFYSYLTVLIVHIGMEAMHCAGSTVDWATDLVTPTHTTTTTITTTYMCTHVNKYMTASRSWRLSPKSYMDLPINMHSFMHIHAQGTYGAYVLLSKICQHCLRMEMVPWSSQASTAASQSVAVWLYQLTEDSLKWSTHICHWTPRWSIGVTSE